MLAEDRLAARMKEVRDADGRQCASDTDGYPVEHACSWARIRAGGSAGTGESTSLVYTAHKPCGQEFESSSPTDGSGHGTARRIPVRRQAPGETGPHRPGHPSRSACAARPLPRK